MILITGGAGFIGSHLTERLLTQGRQVTVLDNFNSAYPPAIKRANLATAATYDNFRLVEGDICDQEFCEQLFQEIQPRIVVHLAARAGVRDSLQMPLLYEHVNCFGTLNLLQLAVKYQIRRFIFASSSSVYGGTAIPFHEDQPAAVPYSPYAATKRAGELYCANFHHLYQLPVIMLRFFTVYGPRQRPEMAIHKFVRLIYQGQEIPVFGDGDSSRDYTYIDDIVDGIIAAMHSELAFEVFNLGNSNTISLSALIRLLEKVLGRKARLRHLPSQDGDVPHTCACIDKARRLLGYNPDFPLERGIEHFVAWFKETQT